MRDGALAFGNVKETVREAVEDKSQEDSEGEDQGLQLLFHHNARTRFSFVSSKSQRKRIPAASNSKTS